MLNQFFQFLRPAILFFAVTASIFALAENNHNDTSEKSRHPEVIVPEDLPYEALSLNQIRAIFSMRVRRWPDGSPITVMVLRDQNPIHKNFLKSTLQMLPHQLRRHWDRYIYSGIGQGPIVVTNQGEMLEKVRQTDGAIGYIEEGVPHEQVRALAIR